MTEKQIQTIRKAVTAVFQTLRKEGCFANQNYLCCCTCALCAIEDREGAEKGKRYVYYHKQSARRFRAGGGLALYYGLVNYAGTAKTVQFGRHITHLLELQGLKVEWNEDPSKVIRIVGVAA